MYSNYSKNERDSIVDKTEAIEKVKAYKILLKDHFNMNSLYLFGSYANNTYTKDSDIDVAVIVDQIDGDFFAVNPLLWKLRRQIDDRIEPIIIEKNYDDANFLDEVIRTGIEIK